LLGRLFSGEIDPSAPPMTLANMREPYGVIKIAAKPAATASTVKIPAKNSLPDNSAIPPQARANIAIAIDVRAFVVITLQH
jgi:hypothetical protein